MKTIRLQPGSLHPLYLVWVLRLVSRLRSTLATTHTAWNLRHVLDAAGVPSREGRLPTARVLRTRLASLASEPAAAPVILRNVEMLAEALALSDVERDVLGFACVYATHTAFDAIFSAACPETMPEILDLLGIALERPIDDLAAALSGASVLLASGLLHPEAWLVHGPGDVVAPGLERAITRPHANATSLLAAFGRPSPAPRLSVTDVRHLGGLVSRVTGLLRHAAAHRTPGVGVLIHGPPGTGKTELARLLAHEAGVLAFEVPLVDEDDDALSGPARLAAWKIAQRMVAHRDGAILIFDEFDDALYGRDDRRSVFGPRSSPSKGWINRAIEECVLPTLWITNDIDHLDAAYLRRFTLLVQLRVPPREVRRALLDRNLGGLPVSTEWKERRAADERLTPAVIERAAEVAGLFPDAPPAELEATLDAVICPHVEAGPGLAGESRDLPPHYDPGLLNASVALDDVCARIGTASRATLCLHGPPGTGKTLWVHHLASRLGRHVVTRRGSDLLSKWVGGTEQQIAETFRSAARDRGTLRFLDEVDGLLTDRRAATASWEVSMTNELLGWLDHVDALVVAATNRLELLDPAVLRRFDLKIRFDPLGPQQRHRAVLAALERLGVGDEGPLAARVHHLDGLTLGDVEAAARHCTFAGTPTASGLLDALEQELAIRSARRAVGFGQASRG